MGILTVVDIEDEDVFLEKVLEIDIEDVQKISKNRLELPVRLNLISR